MTKTNWHKAENYHTQDILLQDNEVIYKDYWDPGKNPNVTRIKFEEFRKGKFNKEILMAFDRVNLKEIKDSIQEILQNQEK
jgi:hypothetical protein